MKKQEQWLPANRDATIQRRRAEGVLDRCSEGTGGRAKRARWARFKELEAREATGEGRGDAS